MVNAGDCKGKVWLLRKKGIIEGPFNVREVVRHPWFGRKTLLQKVGERKWKVVAKIPLFRTYLENPPSEEFFYTGEAQAPSEGTIAAFAWRRWGKWIFWAVVFLLVFWLWKWWKV